jgi:hypothetical protein
MFVYFSLDLMRTRAISVLWVVLTTVGISSARITASWTYQQMYEKADLVVIAYGVSTRDTAERTTLSDLEPHVPVIGVVSEFKTSLVLKGPRDTGTFLLHHYRLASPRDQLAANSPNLIRLSEAHLPFLMFLVKEPDGRYAPVTGQTDPALYSVIELKSAGN